MRISTSVSSMVVLSLTVLSLTSCGLPGSKSANLKSLTCVTLLKDGEIEVKVSNNSSVKTGTISNRTSTGFDLKLRGQGVIPNIHATFQKRGGVDVPHYPQAKCESGREQYLDLGAYNPK